MRALVRPTLALVGVLGIGLASAASAATGPSTLTYSDPAGDAVPTAAGNDILGVTFTTTGKTTKKSYTPKALVVSLKLAAEPSTVPGTLYEIDADTAGCGTLSLYFTPGADGSGSFVSCGSEPDATTGSTATDFGGPEVNGSTVTWTIPIAALPKEMPLGSTISGFKAYSTQADPVLGLVGPYLVDSSLNYDNADSDATYKIG